MVYRSGIECDFQFVEKDQMIERSERTMALGVSNLAPFSRMTSHLRVGHLFNGLWVNRDPALG